MSILTGRSQMLGPAGIPHRRFFSTYFFSLLNRSLQLLSTGTGPMELAHVASNAQRPGRPRVMLASSRSRLRCSHPVDCIVQDSNRTHPSGSLEPRIRYCAVVATTTAVEGAEGPVVQFRTSSSTVVWLEHQGKKRPRGIRWLRQARRRWRSPLNLIYFKNKSCT